MVNANKFRAKMVEQGYTQKSLATAAGMNENTLGAKINGKSFFDTREVGILCNLMHIEEPAEKCDIFLA